MATISEVARDLFKRLKAECPENVKVGNGWVIENTSFPNLPLFLSDAEEDDKKAFCVMLKKALDSKDFSAFTQKPGAKPEPEEEPEEEAKAEPEPAEKPTPKATEDTQSEPEPEPTPEMHKHVPEANPPSGLVDSAIATLAGAVAIQKIKGFTPQIVTEVIEKLGGKLGKASVSEDLIREMIREELATALPAAIKDHFKKIIGG